LTNAVHRVIVRLARVAELVDAAAFQAEVLSGACRFKSCRGHYRNPKETQMKRAGKKMKVIDDDIARIDAEIARLQVLREGLVRAKFLMSGGATPPPSTPEARKRSPNIKPLILDYMRSVEAKGATSLEVSAVIKERVPTVAKDTVGSVLSRLKADGALAYDGERYYDARYAPKLEQRPFEPRVVA
jgi:hypothetical protein